LVLVPKGADAEHAHGRWANVYLVEWRVRATEASVARVSAGVAELCADFPKGCGLLIVAKPDSEMPSRALVERIAKEMDRHAALAAQAFAYEGSGLKHTMVRSMATMVSLLRRRSGIWSMTETATEAAGWLAPRLSAGFGAPLPPEALAAALAQLRAIPHHA
jgi:hypothetical protein